MYSFRVLSNYNNIHDGGTIPEYYNMSNEEQWFYKIVKDTYDSTVLHVMLVKGSLGTDFKYLVSLDPALIDNEYYAISFKNEKQIISAINWLNYNSSWKFGYPGGVIKIK